MSEARRTATPSQAAAPAGEVAEVTVYSKPDCHLCEAAMVVLRRLQRELGFALHERDISSEDAMQRAYFERIPVVAIDGEDLCEHFVDETLVRERLESRR